MPGKIVRLTAPAKVNLYLSVGERRSDGYHDVITVLHTLAFADTVTIAESPSFSFACRPDLGLAPEDNLAFRAVRALAQRLERDASVAVEIEKRIPSAGGLGGASADAAAVLCGLATLWGISPKAPYVTDVARSLGADVPFFLQGGAALYVGRGDVLARVLPALDTPVVLVNPGEPVPTAASYAAFDRLQAMASPPVDSMLEALESRDARRAGVLLHNGLTEASAGIVPAITHVVRMLAEDPGVFGAAMAGSGSTVFGLCVDEATAERLASQARAMSFWAVATRTSGTGCDTLRAL